MMMSESTMQVYAQKLLQVDLMEFEMLAYEQICRTITTQMKYIDVQMQKNIEQFEKDHPAKEE